MQNETTALFPDLSPKSGIIVADGYGIRVFVNRRHLVVADGIGRQRRERRFPRATTKMQRLIVLGHTGFVSFEALRWLTDLGIAFDQIDRDGKILTTSATFGVDDARLRRAQALATTSSTGLEITRMLLSLKVQGQHDVAAKIPASEVALRDIAHFVQAIERARSVDDILVAEAAAANIYWSAWQEVPVTFARKDEPRVSEYWRKFGQRSSPLTGQPRLAANPANSVLNYCYALLEAESRIACLAVGLDAGLGVFHRDQKARDSLALDVMEAARPTVDRYVLDLLTTRVLRARDFHETRQGVCRILTPLTHHLAETLPEWRKAVAPIVERVAQMLGSNIGARNGRQPTPLTQTNRSVGRDAHRRRTKITPRAAKPAHACRSCGIILETTGRDYCDACRPERQMEALSALQVAGPAALARLRAEGRDPSHSEEARRKQRAKMVARSDEAWDWDVRHPVRPDPSEFTGEILPRLTRISLRRLMEATGLSKHYCSRIRRGLHVPHPRFWEALRALCEGNEA